MKNQKIKKGKNQKGDIVLYQKSRMSPYCVLAHIVTHRIARYVDRSEDQTPTPIVNAALRLTQRVTKLLTTCTLYGTIRKHGEEINSPETSSGGVL